jgi:VanZ family protein
LLARWADSEPTFRNFPAFAVLSFAATLFSFLWTRSVSAASAFHAQVFVSVFSVVLEILQFWLPGRSFDRVDIAWSITGAFAGSVAAFYLCRSAAGIFFRRG